MIRESELMKIILEQGGHDARVYSHYLEKGIYSEMWHAYDKYYRVSREFFQEIPEDQRYQTLIDVFHNTEFPGKRFNRFFQMIKPYVPATVTESLAERVEDDGFLTIYRGGTILDNFTLCPSWTLDLNIARWYAKRLLLFGVYQGQVCKGKIKPADVIAYVQDRKEAEIIQYRRVKGVEVAEVFNKFKVLV